MLGSLLYAYCKIDIEDRPLTNIAKTRITHFVLVNILETMKYYKKCIVAIGWYLI